MLIALLAAAAVLTGCLSGQARARRRAGWSSRSRTTPSSSRATLALAGRPSRSTTRGRSGSPVIRANLSWAYTMYPRQYRAAASRPGRSSTTSATSTRWSIARRQNGIRVHLSLTGPAPRWANSRKLSRRAGAWYKPNAAEFGKWAGVVAEHFAAGWTATASGTSRTGRPGSARSQPARRSTATSTSRGYNAIKTADPAAKVLIGETSPYGSRAIHRAARVPARRDLREHEVQARPKSCPKLKADGYAHHPYDFAHAPNFKYPGADNVTIGTLSRLTKALDKLERVGRAAQERRRPDAGLPDGVRLLRHGHAGAAQEDALALPPAGLLDRAEERAREEPAPVPAVDPAAATRARRSTPGS